MGRTIGHPGVYVVVVVVVVVVVLFVQQIVQIKYLFSPHMKKDKMFSKPMENIVCLATPKGEEKKPIRVSRMSPPFTSFSRQNVKISNSH